MPINESCQGNEVITTEDRCKDAAKELGLAYQIIFRQVDSKVHPLGCYYENDNTAWFNENVDGPTNPAKYGKYGGVCDLQGKLYQMKMFILFLL